MANNESPSLRGGTIDLEDEQAAADWREHFGITASQLEEAVLAVGSDSAAVKEHLLNQGASSGPG